MFEQVIDKIEKLKKRGSDRDLKSKLNECDSRLSPPPPPRRQGSQDAERVI